MKNSFLKVFNDTFQILSKNTRVLLPTFEAALAGEISYGTNMSVPRVGLPGIIFHGPRPGRVTESYKIRNFEIS